MSADLSHVFQITSVDWDGAVPGGKHKDDAQEQHQRRSARCGDPSAT
ncbi:MAG: hypothetical protein HY000_31730 [Planctomycetes bacterium]|nr:hypothetical protein [Planctomycetota bacterium]